MNYTVTPSKTGYTFSPTSLSYTNLSANQTVQTFTATATVTYAISGNVGVSGVTMTLSGGQSATVTTDPSGTYSLASILPGMDYIVTPSKTGYTFSTASLSYTNLSSNQTAQNFTGTFAAYTISGHIQNASAIAISGVTMTLSGGQSGSTTTDDSGNYSFASLPSTNNYTVTPSKTSYTFTPSSRTYTNLIANQPAADFTGTSNIWYSIDGSITNGSNGGSIPGVTLSLSGGKTATATTDSSGYYLLGSLPSTNNYTITPSKTYYTFSPTSITYNNLAAYEYNANFTGTTTVTFTISGHLSGSGMSGVTVYATSGPAATTTTTDANGDYSLTLPAGMNYTVYPQKTSYTFGASRQYNNLNANQTGANFTGTYITYTIGELSATEPMLL